MSPTGNDEDGLGDITPKSTKSEPTPNTDETRMLSTEENMQHTQTSNTHQNSCLKSRNSEAQQSSSTE
eukprot:6612453-Karenia_brevis.AAC.1